MTTNQLQATPLQQEVVEIVCDLLLILISSARSFASFRLLNFDTIYNIVKR